MKDLRAFLFDGFQGIKQGLFVALHSVCADMRENLVGIPSELFACLVECVVGLHRMDAGRMVAVEHRARCACGHSHVLGEVKE